MPKYRPGQEPPPIPREDKESGWTWRSQRTGVLATKVGMLTFWDEYGYMRPVTALQLGTTF